MTWEIEANYGNKISRALWGECILTVFTLSHHSRNCHSCVLPCDTIATSGCLDTLWEDQWFLLLYHVTQFCTACHSSFSRGHSFKCLIGGCRSVNQYCSSRNVCKKKKKKLFWQSKLLNLATETFLSENQPDNKQLWSYCWTKARTRTAAKELKTSFILLFLEVMSTFLISSLNRGWG